MNKRLNAAVVLTMLLAVIAVTVSIKFNENHKNFSPNAEEKPQSISATEDEAKEKMRGLWISYISLDMTGTDRSEEAFREKIRKIAKTAEEYNCNSVFIHVRAFSDAFYNSQLFPSSHVLWGEQGAEQSFDGLSIICEEFHKESLAVHAWINPYRVTASKDAFELSANNIYSKNKDICIEYNEGIYLNPAKREARKFIVDGVKEIIENYPVDGIHFDDYFYPTSDEDFDKEMYNTYLKSCKSQRDAMPLTKWRQNNVNMLVSEVYRCIKSFDKNISFGISPQGNIENDLYMGADIKSWCEQTGYVDYICPQLYFSLENPALGFEAGLEDWLEFDFHTGLDFYVGLGVYKAGTDADSGTWLKEDNILSRELELIRKKKLQGFVLYDYEAMLKSEAQAELINLNKLL